jgi:4-amino-4-deoxy-L-arabinose transferase-like glycosyltransferase
MTMKREMALRSWLETAGREMKELASSRSRVWLVALAIAICQLCLAVVLPPAEDELYYWAWSKSLSVSYYDHPPLVALLIGLPTRLFGDAVWAIRLGGPLGALVLWAVTASLLERPGRLLPLLFVPASFLFPVFLTPDVPLLVFWSLHLAWVARLVDDLRRDEVPLARWAVGGLWLGLGLLSKYTMALAVPCLALALLPRCRSWREWWPGILAYGAVAVALFSPVVAFNWAHEFAPIRFQWGHQAEASTGGWKALGEFALGQALLWGALPLALLPVAFARAWPWRREPRLWACACFSLPPFVFFLAKATLHRVEANWPAVAFVGMWPIAERLCFSGPGPTAKRVLAAVAMAPAYATTVVLLSNTIVPVFDADHDRYRRLVAYGDVSAAAAADAGRLAPGEAVYCPTYQWVSYLRFRGVPSEQIHPAWRPSQFTLFSRPTCEQSRIVAFLPAELADTLLSCFDKRETLAEYSVTVRGRTIERLRLVRMSRQ